MKNANSPTFSKITDWIDGLLDPEEEQELIAALENGDLADRADLQWARTFKELSQKGIYRSPPKSVHETLVAQFSKYTASKKPPNLFQTFLAELRFDSRLHIAAAGMRSATKEGRSIQLHYQAEQADIALSLEPDPARDQVGINGQIFPRSGHEPVGWSIQALDEDGSKELGLAASDEFGEFILTGLPAGRCELVISGDGVEISLPAIDLKH